MIFFKCAITMHKCAIISWKIGKIQECLSRSNRKLKKKKKNAWIVGNMKTGNKRKKLNNIGNIRGFVNI